MEAPCPLNTNLTPVHTGTLSPLSAFTSFRTLYLLKAESYSILYLAFVTYYNFLMATHAVFCIVTSIWNWVICHCLHFLFVFSFVIRCLTEFQLVLVSTMTKYQKRNKFGRRRIYFGFDFKHLIGQFALLLLSKVRLCNMVLPPYKKVLITHLILRRNDESGYYLNTLL